MPRKYKKEFLVILVLAIIVLLESALLIIFRPQKPKKIVKPEIAVTGKVAIIVDDWGYSLKNADFLEAIKIPFDVSVLPFLPYSQKIAEEARMNNKEVMLHLPLEPHPNPQVRLESKVILANMGREKVLEILKDALKSVPYAKGINNHMGSLATESRDLMAIIFQEMKKRKLFFVDSMVTVNSVCPELAEQMQLKFAERSVFLDNENNAGYISGQFSLLIKKAKKQGQAIGIGHDRALTLELLRKLAPEAEKQGIKFVFASELAK